MLYSERVVTSMQIYVSTLGLRSDQQTCECVAKLDVKAAFASLSAFSFPEITTCEGIHAMTIWACGGIFLSPFLTTSRIATTVAITTDLQILVFSFESYNLFLQ